MRAGETIGPVPAVAHVSANTARLSNSGEHLSFLDYLRGVAIMVVFVYHGVIAAYGIDQLDWKGWFRDFHATRSFLFLLPATMGWSGVPIFFVVSGFCIHLSHERSRAKGYKVYFARRFFRIYPPYLAALLFFAFFFPLSRLGFHSLHDFADLGSHLLLIHNFDRGLCFGINGAFWSIAVEVQLYLLYPLLIILVQRLGWKRALWFMGALEITLRGIRGWYYGMGLSLPTWFTLCPFAFWFSWSIGAVLADGYLKARPLILRGNPLWLWPCVTLGCYLIRPLDNFCFVGVALWTGTVIARLLSPSHAPARGGNFGLGPLWKHIRWTGVISYSVYLIHQPLVGLVPRALQTLFPGRTIHPLAVFGCCLLEWPLVLIVAFGLYRFVEQPSIELGKWYIRTKLNCGPRITSAA